MTTKTIAFTSGTSWTLPSDAQGATATIICIGAGANGAAGNAGAVSSGGGGISGCIAQTTSFTLPSSGSVSYQVPAGGTSTTCWFSSTSVVLANSSSSSTTGMVGDIKVAGNGGAGGSGINSGSGGGGGGGAPGISTAGSGGSSPTAGTGGAGGSAGTPSYTLTAGGTAGPGNGGSGGTFSGGGGGGSYGGGGGGGGLVSGVPICCVPTFVSQPGGSGAQGVIIVIYTPVVNTILTTINPNYDQPNPRGYIPATDLKTFVSSSATLQSLLNVVQIKPFLQTDWPNPSLGPFFNRNVIQHLNAVETQLIGKDQFFGAAGQPPANLDWPVPKGPQFPLENRGYVRSLSEFYSAQLLYYAPGMGVPQLDWPVPKGYVPATDLKTWAINNTIPLFTLENMLLGFKYPNPIYDWPVPKGYIPSIDLKTWIKNHTLIMVQEDLSQMGTVYDWPNPRGYIPATELKTWVQHTNLQLLEQQNFFYGNRGPVYDYPNPRGYQIPNSQYAYFLKSILNIRAPSTQAFIF